MSIITHLQNALAQDRTDLQAMVLGVPAACE